MTDTLEPPTPEPAASDAVADAETTEQPAGQSAPETGAPDAQPDIDLDVIEADLAGVEHALARLAEGTYWVDEVSGAAIPDDVLISSPTARRATPH